MWPFKKRAPKEEVKWVEELTHNSSHPIGKVDAEPYVIQVGIGHYTNKPDRFRVFFRMTQRNWSDLTVIPRQHNMDRARALVAADAWVKALETTYQMSLEQLEADSD